MQTIINGKKRLVTHSIIKAEGQKDIESKDTEPTKSERDCDKKSERDSSVHKWKWSSDQAPRVKLVNKKRDDSSVCKKPEINNMASEADKSTLDEKLDAIAQKDF